MRYAFLADIHANIAALKAVLGDIERQVDVDAVVCLGDIAGYGPDTAECVGLLKAAKAVSVSGNHDLAVLGKLGLGYFSPDAAQAARWTSEKLDTGSRAYLGALPATMAFGEFTAVHGSPRQPAWEYLISLGSARQNFAHFKTPYCLVGHSHLPLVFRKAGDDVSFLHPSEHVALCLEGWRYIINPGSVGQPRDGDPRASYALYETGSRMLRFRRIAYDIAAEQHRFFQAGLPLRLASRLEQGA
jgi:diadenosine tetraphosphatase ApaH/serine/threonine PP2A family protein phosphatase